MLLRQLWWKRPSSRKPRSKRVTADRPRGRALLWTRKESGCGLLWEQMLPIVPSVAAGYARIPAALCTEGGYGMRLRSSVVVIQPATGTVPASVNNSTTHMLAQHRLWFTSLGGSNPAPWEGRSTHRKRACPEGARTMCSPGIHWSEYIMGRHLGPLDRTP